MIAALARLDVRPVLIGGFVLLAIMVLWTQAQPFASLSDYGVIDDPTQSNTLRRNLTLAILALAYGLVRHGGQSAQLWQTISPGLIVIFAWFALTALVSPSPGLALNRLALAAIVIAIAVCLPLLFARLDDFVTVLGLAASAAIVLSFLGAMFVPDLAIHSLRDAVEQGLAGDWRGIFKHKNDLAPMAIHFCFIGILLWQLQRRAWGAAMVAGALLLLMLSGGKSAALLLLPSLVGAAIIVRAGRAVAAIVAVGLVAGLVLLTLGSVAFPSVGAIVAHLPDPTFTGRADIWQLALEAAGQRSLTGFGYNIFWDTGAAYTVAAAGDTAAQVSHAHNGFLEVTLSAGLPGLSLVLAWTAIAPLRQIEAIKRRQLDRAERAFLFYLVAAWLFTLLISSLEAVLFNRGDSIWFTGLLALVCLRLWSRAALLR